MTTSLSVFRSVSAKITRDLFQKLAAGFILAALLLVTQALMMFIVQSHPFSPERSDLYVGFPFAYYREFFIHDGIYSVWETRALIADYLSLIPVGAGIAFLILPGKRRTV